SMGIRRSGHRSRTGRGCERSSAATWRRWLETPRPRWPPSGPGAGHVGGHAPAGPRPEKAEEGLSRTLRTVIAAVLVAGGAAGAQPAGDAGLPPSGAVYDLTQGGVRLGESTVDVMETTEGFLSRSRVDLPGIASLEDELVAGPDGAARSYA